MRWPRVVQFVATIAVIALAMFAIPFRSHIGFKGAAVPIVSLVTCFAASCVVAYITARAWHWVPAPFVAGIVGVVTGGRLGPVGGIFGFFVGLAVAVAVLAESRLNSRSP